MFEIRYIGIENKIKASKTKVVHKNAISFSSDSRSTSNFNEKNIPNIDGKYANYKLLQTKKLRE